MASVPVTAGAVRPKRLWMGPAFMAKAIEARGAGAMQTPARSGLKCQTSCMNRAVLSRTMAKPAENRNRATVAAVNCLPAKSCFSITGALARRVRSTVEAAARAAAANRATVRRSVQPHPGPWTVASTSRLTASSSARAEAASGTAAPLGRRTSGSSNAPATRVAMPTGTLIRKIHRQSRVTSSPPTGGPAEAAIAPTPAHRPTTRVCWRLGKLG